MAAKIGASQMVLIVLGVLAFLLVWVFFIVYYKFLRRRSDRVGDPESGASKEETPLKGEVGVARRFKWEEIERMTSGFSSAVIGEGGFSTVYLARFPDESLGAVKVHRNSERLHRAFKEELEIVLHVSHTNIARFIGYCDEREEGVLVFEYVPNGSLHDHLHSNPNPLTWNQRTWIAYDLARALQHLHENQNPYIVHGDVTSNNILLDHRFKPKLCDFGSAKMGFSSAVTNRSVMMGSPGYVDPHYVRTGLMSKKSDVYSFGVIVLELLMGREAYEDERMIASVAAPMIEDSAKAVAMKDERLGGQFDSEEVVAMGSLAAMCVGEQPSLRPSMGDVLRFMEEKVPSAKAGKVAGV
ncbi:putative receptor-like protein kinase [Acorus calamus]|uniref:Receptor-like protein kinase n=1 Tax=Acorus calamus TaxID=4465 RepID=A0AAV9D3B4_ACOCL|nr:putative receptor-like protein kinase [Acorus calamus]